MKRISIILFAVFVCLAGYSQTYSLEFKGVRIFQLAGTCNNTWGGTVATQTLTVPVGSVYKIESASASLLYNGSSKYFTFQNQAGLSLDHNVLVAYSYSSNSYMIQIVKADFPIWLPAGTYTLRLYDNSGSGLSATYDLKGFVSAIEFELITL